MYLPAHFKPDEMSVRELLREQGAADLITLGPSGLAVTMLPFLYDPPGSRPAVGELGSLVGHLARNNPQWREVALAGSQGVSGESLIIIHGPDAYISPVWYPASQAHGRVVPTWNYVTALVYGELVIHDDLPWISAFVRRLTEHYEAKRVAGPRIVENGAGRGQPFEGGRQGSSGTYARSQGSAKAWSIDDAPADYIAGQLRSIVGVELLITRIEAKFKLSQNRSEADIQGAISGLEESGQAGQLTTAARMRAPRR